MVTLIVKARSRSLLDIAYRSLWSVLLPVKRKDCLDDARLQFFPAAFLYGYLRRSFEAYGRHSHRQTDWHHRSGSSNTIS